MTLDYRSAGSRDHHGGTFTASVPLLTPAAKIRFQHNDVRAANNELYDRVQKQHLVQQVVNENALIQQYQHDRQQVAIIQIAFQLYQSTFTDSPTEGKVATERSMEVLLLKVDQATQGAEAPMGGTGWLVSNYALDAATVAIVQPV